MVYAPRPQRRRWSFVATLPAEVLVVGLAIAVYANDSVVQYASLEEFLEDHGLSVRDLVRRDELREASS